MMTGSFMCPGSIPERIFSQHSYPVMPGIWMSSRMRSGNSPAKLLRSSRKARACLPSITGTTLQKSESEFFTTSWFTSSSSTDRTRGGTCSSGSGDGAPSGTRTSCPSSRASGTTRSAKPRDPSQGSETVNVEPLPSSEASRSSPPCSFTISVHTERPRPMPWKVLPPPLVSCSKGWKTRRWPSSEMPLPVSATSISNAFCSATYVASIVMEPL
mmetsp:Transcript_79588/g.237067  ORF Transcript_79588/g.237067 Transcript_79588/m.237067 type:complete len:214 (+) Transcript_79588:80-721(+)